MCLRPSVHCYMNCRLIQKQFFHEAKSSCRGAFSIVVWPLFIINAYSNRVCAYYLDKNLFYCFLLLHNKCVKFCQNFICTMNRQCQQFTIHTDLCNLEETFRGMNAEYSPCLMYSTADKRHLMSTPVSISFILIWCSDVPGSFSG